MHSENYLKGKNNKMDTILPFVWSAFLQLLAIAIGCAFFLVDRERIRRVRMQRQHTTTKYRREFLFVSLIFLLPTLGKTLPEMIISLVVFRGSVLPSSPDFTYQLHTHSLDFFIWLAVVSIILSTALIMFTIFLGILIYKQRERSDR